MRRPHVGLEYGSAATSMFHHFMTNSLMVFSVRSATSAIRAPRLNRRHLRIEGPRSRGHDLPSLRSLERRSAAPSAGIDTCAGSTLANRSAPTVVLRLRNKDCTLLFRAPIAGPFCNIVAFVTTWMVERLP
jgi:hypothetical protein